MLTETTFKDSVVPGILTHKSTLKRLAIHSRQDSFGNPTDKNIPSSTIEQLYNEIKLRCFGVYIGVLRLVKSTQSPSSVQ